MQAPALMATEDTPPRRFRLLGGADPKAHGPAPDYRFTLANERTFLAWMRTSLALVGGGLAIKNFIHNVPGHLPIALFVILMGLYLGSTSYFNWSRNEHAISHGAPLPGSYRPAILAAGVAIAGIAVITVVLLT